MQISKKIIPWVLFFIFFFLTVGTYSGLFKGPSDFQQGEIFKIIYIHIPAAWCCILNYILLTLCSLVYILTKNPIMNLIAKSLAHSGCLFTIITLITGSLWGAPTWGTYWVWDARLTSVLILFFIYVTYIIITKRTDEKTPNTAAIVAIIGFINIPIIKYSVTWWTTLHQPASITFTKVSIDISMLLPIILFTLAFLCYTFYLILLYIREHLILYKIYNIKRLHK